LGPQCLRIQRRQRQDLHIPTVHYCRREGRHRFDEHHQRRKKFFHDPFQKRTLHPKRFDSNPVRRLNHPVRQFRKDLRQPVLGVQVDFAVQDLRHDRCQKALHDQLQRFRKYRFQKRRHRNSIPEFLRQLQPLHVRYKLQPSGHRFFQLQPSGHEQQQIFRFRQFFIFL
jgi:hypothetical protein